MYSVVIPVYNSEKSLLLLSEQIVTYFKTRNLCFEIIFVDDHSINQTHEVLSLIKKKYSKLVKIVYFKKNHGQHLATACGIFLANGEYIFTIDDDLQSSPEDFDILIKRINETNAGVVYGVSSRTLGRRQLVYKLFKNIVNLLLGREVYISSFRLMKKSVAKEAIKTLSHSFILDYYISYQGVNIDKVVVQVRKRLYGKTNYALKNSVKLLLKGVVLHHKVFYNISIYILICYLIFLLWTVFFEIKIIHYKFDIFFFCFFVVIFFLYTFGKYRYRSLNGVILKPTSLINIDVNDN